jgi:hypothetical protein
MKLREVWDCHTWSCAGRALEAGTSEALCRTLSASAPDARDEELQAWPHCATAQLLVNPDACPERGACNGSETALLVVLCVSTILNTAAVARPTSERQCQPKAMADNIPVEGIQDSCWKRNNAVCLAGSLRGPGLARWGLPG